MFVRTPAANLPNHKVEHIFSLREAFLMNASQLQVTNFLSEKKFADPSFGKFSVDLFLLTMKRTILSRLIFAFAKSVLLISNVLMVRKEELFIKSPKLQ